jgi:toxin-antitoxin system PIN domain toxin
VPGSLLDSNVWVAATFPRHEFHAAALAVLRSATLSQPAVFCRATEQSFLRLATSPHMLARYDQPGLTNRDALAALNLLLARPSIQIRDEPPGTVSLWHRLAARDTASPKVWMDAYLAAFAMAGDLSLVTLDRDFKGYEAHGLRLSLLVPSRA